MQYRGRDGSDQLAPVRCAAFADAANAAALPRLAFVGDADPLWAPAHRCRAYWRQLMGAQCHSDGEDDDVSRFRIVSAKTGFGSVSYTHPGVITQPEARVRRAAAAAARAPHSLTHRTRRDHTPRTTLGARRQLHVWPYLGDWLRRCATLEQNGRR